MEALIYALNIILPVSYIAVTIMYGLFFFRSDRTSSKYMSKLLTGTVTIHLIILVLRGYKFGYFPSADIFEMSSVLAFAVAATYVYLQHRLKIQSTGFFILIVVCFLQLLSSIFITFDPEIPDILKSPMFILHTSTVILGYSALFVSAAYSVMYLMLFYDLKSAQFSVIYRKMPSLEELLEMSMRSAFIGFIFFTITIFLGMMWRKYEFPELSHFDPKVITSYGIWLIFGTVLYGKKIGSWTGKWLAYASIGGFLFIILSMVFIKMIVDSFHQFG